MSHYQKVQTIGDLFIQMEKAENPSKKAVYQKMIANRLDCIEQSLCELKNNSRNQINLFGDE